jgi:hypothetical protein
MARFSNWETNEPSRERFFDVGGWPGLKTAEATTPAGAPSFAYFAKGGYDDGIHNG